MALVCHCHVVNDGIIQDAVATGACSVADVRDVCGAGGSCGGCVPAIEALVEQLAARLEGAAA